MSHTSTRGLSKLVLLFLTAILLLVVPMPAAAQGPIAEPALPAGAVEVPHSPDLDQAVATISAALSLVDPTYYVWALPATATSEEIFQYYADLMDQSGWTNQGATGQDPALGEYAFWTSDDGASALLVLFIAKSASTPVATVLAILGTFAGDAGQAGAPALRDFAPAPAPTVTPDPYAIPAGKAAILVKSYYGTEVNFTINRKLHKIPANGELFLILDPGKYNWSANIPGRGNASGTAELEADVIFPLTFSD